jgi:hypothetical protein
MTNCAHFDHEAEVVSEHQTKESADKNCPNIPGYTVEEWADGLDHINAYGQPVYTR